ncbi:MAG: DUF1707 SHOCT-like domain-containing protein [Acidimicrobiales bacterium]
MAATPPASTHPPSERSRQFALATVLAACRSGRLDLTQAEERLDAVYRARTFGELHAAIAGLPHPPAPLVLPTDSSGDP